MPSTECPVPEDPASAYFKEPVELVNEWLPLSKGAAPGPRCVGGEVLYSHLSAPKMMQIIFVFDCDFLTVVRFRERRRPSEGFRFPGSFSSPT